MVRWNAHAKNIDEGEKEDSGKYQSLNKGERERGERRERERE